MCGDNVVALRLDDVGACTKRYEVYSLRTWRLGPITISANWLFLKYLPPFKAWGPYREIMAREWREIYDLLRDHQAKLTVAVTAAWVESERRVVPFPEKFPDEAAVLKEGVGEGLLEIANHGLTHCLLSNDAFKPKWFSSNRRYHREFYDWIPREQHEKHIRHSQEILQSFFEADVVTLVPPGNVFSDTTLEIAQRYGIRYVSCKTPPRIHGQIAIVGDEQVLPFHDKDIVLNGVSWLAELLASNKDKEICFVKDLGEQMLTCAGSSSLAEQ